MRTEPLAPSAAATFFLMLLLGVVWLAVGALVASGVHPAMTVEPLPRAMVAIPSIVAGLVAVALAFALRRRSRLGYYTALAFLAASALAVVFDQVGWADLLFVALNVTPVILLIRDRLWYVDF